jgi:HAMP domain-containing protein/signal transduction histidine kinase/ActR/RegA family two-component response regulator
MARLGSNSGSRKRHLDSQAPGAGHHDSAVTVLPGKGRQSVKSLEHQFSTMLTILSAVKDGDFSARMPIAVDGIAGDVARKLNSIIARIEATTNELMRVSAAVAREGRLTERVASSGECGGWATSVDSINLLIGELVRPTTEVARVIRAVAAGDLSQKITVEVKGEILELKNTINTMVETLRSFSAEVTRVAREVGTEGKLGGQADVKGVSGTWKDLTDNVNSLVGNLTNQVRNIAAVSTAVANGDLSRKITVEAKGEILQLKDTINKMVDQLNSFAAEVTRVAKEVGTAGKLGGQAEVTGVSGTWKDLTDNVNFLAGNLTSQVRNIAAVTTAVARGDLSKKITVEAKGEILELKNTINTMVDQLNSFAGEVTRVAREVGTEGKLGAQAEVSGVSGTWRDLTENVNVLAGNLTSQVRNIALVTTSVANGDLSKKITVEAKGEILELKETINTMVDQLRAFASEVARVAREVGTEGKLGGQAKVPGVAGTWKDLTDNVNQLAGNLTNQVRNIALVTKAVANGDLSQKITVEAKGEILELKDTINKMVDQLNSFAAEVTRVAREVGTEGKLGGQAKVPGVAGTWKDLTDNVNVMASNLTSQVRGIAKVVTAVADGDLAQKLRLEAKGEIASLADTINNMTDTLRVFADQVTTVAREVGIEGKLGGQAKVPGAAGTWRDLTDNVNQLAGNLTSQVRSIANVATAVTKGDLTRSIAVEAQGEVLQLKDTINQMIGNLRETTRANKEQDWLKTNLARFSGLMQGQRNVEALSKLIMSELTPVVTAQHGAFYVQEGEGDQAVLKLVSTYAYQKRKLVSNRFSLGESLVGQCALERKSIVVSQVPEDYIEISSGLGEAPPRNIIVLPVLFEGKLKAIIELASFQEFSPIHLTFLDQLMQSIGVVFNMIGASMRTNELLEELQRSNAELEGRSKELEDKAHLLEVRNREIATASASLEEKAQELSQISKYKSDFLANMSHELRTPLNSLLILGKMLADNPEHHLSEKEVEYAKTIHSSGQDLLALINEILDLAKIEAGRMQIESHKVPLAEVRDFAEKSFRQLAQQKEIEFTTTVEPFAPLAITTDVHRLQQILKNILSNAFKFTDHGKVEMSIGHAPLDLHFVNPALRAARRVLAIAVTDTGIGIPDDKQRIIFEAFQQADTTISRKYGGTGLGLTISRELAHLLGGEISLKSRVGKGSTFTLFLPLTVGDLEILRIEKSRQPKQAVLGQQPESRSIEAKKILVIDDDPRNLFSVTSFLEKEKAQVFTAESANEAFDVLRKNPDVDLIVMDIMMPGIDGYQATREIRKIQEFSTVPIIALTAKAMAEDRDKALEAGCSDFVPKPVETDDLLRIVEKWIVEGRK